MTVTTEWNQLKSWLITNAPATAAELLPPNEPQAREVQAAIGHWWGPEVDEWFSLQGGSDPMSAMIVPNFAPLTPAGCLRDWNMYVDSWKGIFGQEEMAEKRLEGVLDTAGSIAGMFLPTYVPLFRNFTGNMLFCDTRVGSEQWRISTWGHDAADETTEHWPSLRKLLAEVNESLESMSQINYYVPSITPDGVLEWTTIGGCT